MRTARVFNGIKEVRIEWNLAGQRVRAGAATAMVLSLAIGTVLMWTISPVVGMAVAAVLILIVLWLNAKINAMSGLDDSGMRADLGECTQLQLLWGGTRHPVIFNNGLTLPRKGG